MSPTPLTRVQLDAMPCAHKECKSGATAHLGHAMTLTGACHRGPVVAKYQLGLVRIICAICGRLVAEVEVAAGVPDLVVEGGVP